MQPIRHLHRPRRLTVLGLLSLTLFASGCTSSLVGAWTPSGGEAGEGAFKQIQFRDDGSFSAVTSLNQKDVLSAGKYSFDGFILTLKPPGRASHSYSAKYIMGGQLTLSADGVDQKLRKQ